MISKHLIAMQNYDRAFRYYFRFLLQIPSIYIPSSLPHIFIFSSRRSGSTVLRDMIASQPGFNYIDEPFNFSINQFHPYKNILGRDTLSQLISISQVDEGELEQFLDKLLNREIVTRSQWRIFSQNYHWHWNRYVVKELNAKNLIYWFQAYLGARMESIFHIRHPIAVALSSINTKWPHYYLDFLIDEEFNSTYLSKNARKISEEIHQSGTEFDKYVLDWCMENLMPINMVKNNLIPIVYYEQIATEPIKTSQFLCKLLNLPNIEQMAKIAVQPSPTSTGKSRSEISKSGPTIRIDKWRNLVDRDQTLMVSRILDAFENDFYTSTSPYPSKL